MERIKELNVFQKGIMLLMAIMIIVFAGIYLKVGSKVGLRYNGKILVQTKENGNTFYTGKFKGTQAQFAVSEDGTVVLEYGDKTYGPYSVTKDEEKPDILVFREDDKVIFRGMVEHSDGSYILLDEDGTFSDANFTTTYSIGDGTEYNDDGSVYDSMKPGVVDIYQLVVDPVMTHKGEGFLWLVGVILCILNAVLILFADEIFRFNLLFSVRNHYDAEPSFFEMAGRYLSWIALFVVAAGIFVYGIVA
ncbi:MAG: hypothetical protein E7254_09050 [Lachnospiraceae bacterium]|nr:hypothetical protein [Lachnospiraceae bacterium]